MLCCVTWLILFMFVIGIADLFGVLYCLWLLAANFLGCLRRFLGVGFWFVFGMCLLMVVCGLVARELLCWWLMWFCMICCLVCLAGLCFAVATHVVCVCLIWWCLFLFGRWGLLLVTCLLWCFNSVDVVAYFIYV